MTDEIRTRILRLIGQRAKTSTIAGIVGVSVAEVMAVRRRQWVPKYEPRPVIGWCPVCRCHATMPCIACRTREALATTGYRPRSD